MAVHPNGTGGAQLVGVVSGEQRVVRGGEQRVVRGRVMAADERLACAKCGEDNGRDWSGRCLQCGRLAPWQQKEG